MGNHLIPARPSIGTLVSPCASLGNWCWGGGEVGSWEVGSSDTGAYASGVGSPAALWTGLPQFEQNLASGSNRCPQ